MPFFGGHPIATREPLDYQHLKGQALSLNEYVRDTRIRRSSCSLCLLFRMERLQFHLHPHSPRASAIRLVSSSWSFDALDTKERHVRQGSAK